MFSQGIVCGSGESHVGPVIILKQLNQLQIVRLRGLDDTNIEITMGSELLTDEKLLMLDATLETSFLGIKHLYVVYLLHWNVIKSRVLTICI